MFKQLYYLEYLLLPIGALIFYKLFKKVRFIIFPAILLPFIYAFFRLEPHIHYYLIVSPFLFLFLGTAFNFLISNKNKLIKYSSYGIYISLIVISIYYNFAFYQTIKNQKNIKGDYGQIFSETEKSTKAIFQRFSNDPAYRDMIIASYIPFSLTHGDIGVARMLYDPKQTEKNMESLEERLKQVPVDRRVQNELIAYYTRKTPSKKTIETLKRKADENEGLRPVYDEVRAYFVASSM